MSKRGNVLRNRAKGEGMLVGPPGNYMLYTESQTPCSLGCPAGVDIKAYVNLIADRRYEEAVQIIRMANPFPGICGRVCTHPCEAECGRKDIDQPVSIRSLKRFASDYELSRKKSGIAQPIIHRQKIAIVGSGPAGLTAASDLALAGFHVTVFDSTREAGGLLSWGIPDFRLPKNIVRSEIRDIQSLGVEIEQGKKIENPIELIENGYSVVILAMGCQSSILPGIPGEGSINVVDCLDFLKNVSEKKINKPPGRVVVIGGGNAALDSARTALRLGADVTVAYRRTEEQMPAGPDEITHAKEEGIDFQFLAIPAEICSDNSKLTVKFQKAKLGESDASGRRSPMPIPDDYFSLEADRVIMAIGSKPELAGFEKSGLKLTKRGTIETDEDRMTSMKGIFAAGDIATGPSTIVDAIGSGHCAAAGVLKFILGEDLSEKKHGEMLIVDAEAPETSQRGGTCFIPVKKRQSTFDEVELGIEERSAITEASRCRRCGSCGVCSVCLAVCDYRNAVISVPGTGESELAKVPFELVKQVMDNPEEKWNLESSGEKIPLNIEPLLATVDKTFCIACGKCEESCPYKAIRTIFYTDGNSHAQIEPSACRGCGACLAACPTGAISMGYMGDANILPRLHDAVKNAHTNNNIVIFSCLWKDPEPSIRTEPREIKLQCTRRASPALLLEALALGAKAVAVRGCADDECHYLPGTWMGPDVVESCHAILEAIDIESGRISYLDDDDSIEKFTKDVQAFKKFQSTAGKIPELKSNLGRCLNAIQILMTQPDREFEIKSNCKILLGCGCLATSEPAFEAYGLHESHVLESIGFLLEKTGINYEIASGIHISGTSLKKWGLDSLYETYSESIVKRLNDSNAKSIVLTTPKSFNSFKEMELACSVEPLPGILKDKLSGSFMKSHGTVAYHPACAGAGDFDEDCLELLGLIPELKVQKIEGKCGDTGWRDVSNESRKMARVLLKSAEQAGAVILITGSTRCAAHLHAVTGGWCTSPVKVMDIYTYLASRLGGEE
ncbi:MAG: FAD-dependent oxidoreductase [Candidatus Thermoplasmatota archaeon]|nr:FAD-dependent oxidoreductase [Candidatus Thermoplasmatota archaeon]MBU4145056.1 FAD-dependent oxidoreductase [Candidatus Thermoplasmatota archaeon]MBU4591988.1 FAD-dependent oxidoreductase [Candidatus Thermoplasmatota archaeon]